MSWFYRHLVRPVLFTQDPEQIHNRTMRALGWIGQNEILCDALASFCAAPELETSLLGCRFPNPVGLAAGMDKNAEALPAWSALGFGFTELGAVTWHPQPGNAAPRVFRGVASESIVNRMGFNNEGAEKVALKLEAWKGSGRWPNHPVGMNLGKSRITPLERAPEDYANSFRVLRPHLDFFVVNVSSPNTPGLRQLQDKTALDEILAALQAVNAGSSASAGQPLKPILVKVAPDLTLEALDEILELAGSRGIAGIVATNTTINRPETTDAELQRVYAEPGGLSGRPLRSRSTEIIRHITSQTGGSLPIIGVGGIFNAEDAWEKIVAGASLIQIYTSLVYEGPWIVRDIVTGLKEKLQAGGMATLTEAIHRRGA